MDRVGGSSDSCYYSILGVRSNASFSEVRAAYRTLAMTWHPDRCARNQLNAELAKQKFQKIQEAYSVLSDNTKRAMYNLGLLKMYEDEEDEEMKQFMRDMFSKVDFEGKNEDEENWEDFYKKFVEFLGKDVANMGGKD